MSSDNIEEVNNDQSKSKICVSAFLSAICSCLILVCFFWTIGMTKEEYAYFYIVARFEMFITVVGLILGVISLIRIISSKGRLRGLPYSMFGILLPLANLLWSVYCYLVIN